MTAKGAVWRKLALKRKPQSEGCGERIRQAMMNDDVGQQRLRAGEQQGSSAGEQPSVATRVEAAQQGPGEGMNQAPVASNARNVRPRTAESGWMEDVVPSRKRGLEEMGPPDDPNLTPADESQMGTSEMAQANFKVAELFCRNRFGESAVDMGFERGLVVNCATGWSMSDEEQMEVVEQRVRDEEPVLLVGSPMCRAFSTLIELTQAGKPSEFELKASWSDASHTSSFAPGCTRRSEMREDCSCMSICGMRGLVASVSSMKWRRKMVCTRRKATCVDFSWQRTVSRKDHGSCRTQSASSKS